MKLVVYVVKRIGNFIWKHCSLSYLVTVKRHLSIVLWMRMRETYKVFWGTNIWLHESYTHWSPIHPSLIDYIHNTCTHDWKTDTRTIDKTHAHKMTNDNHTHACINTHK